MKNQTSGALYAPQSTGVSVPESIKALNEQVNNLQRRYYRSMAPDCDLHSSSDRWYFGAILATCIGLVFPLCLQLLHCAFIRQRNAGKEVRND